MKCAFSVPVTRLSAFFISLYIPWEFSGSTHERFCLKWRSPIDRFDASRVLNASCPIHPMHRMPTHHVHQIVRTQQQTGTKSSHNWACRRRLSRVTPDGDVMLQWCHWTRLREALGTWYLVRMAPRLVQIPLERRRRIFTGAMGHGNMSVTVLFPNA